MDQKPSMGRVVIYNHPGSADGKYPPMKSPAIVQHVGGGEGTPGGGGIYYCDLFVMSNTGGIFFAKNVPLRGHDDAPASNWEWPIKIN